MAKKKFQSLTVKLKHDSELDEDTILSDMEDWLQQTYGEDVSILNHPHELYSEDDGDTDEFDGFQIEQLGDDD